LRMLLCANALAQKFGDCRANRDTPLLRQAPGMQEYFVIYGKGGAHELSS
jgi:hypothetical protein